MPAFFSDDDRAEYLFLVADAARRAGTRCLAWCLMDNHVHLILVPCDADGLRTTLGEAHRRYTRMIIFREGWRGHLFQGRFASYPMDEAHLMTAVRYVESNPVAARMVQRVEQWNGLDQYMTSGSQALSYDDNGNLAGDQSWAFGYDAENQLTSASAPAANLTLAYRYDALGRMDRRQRGSETASDYRYDGQSLIAAHDAGANPHTQRYVHGAGVDAPIVEYTLQSGAYTRKWYAADPKGSVVATTDDAGATTALYAYGDYGEVAPGASGGPAFRYTGQRRDPDSGLYYYKARWYSANLGRFLQTDPIGTEDQINLYAYVGNDPINLSDPTGMYTVGGNSYFSNPGSAGTGYGSPSNNAVFTLTGGATPGIVTPPGVRARDAGPDIVAVALQAATDVVNGMAPRGGYPPWLKGIMIHAAFAVEIKAMNRAGLPVDAEVSYKNGVVVPYGTPGSVRADAVTGNINRPAAIYEMKTGVTTMSRIDLENYMRNLPPGTPVHQLLIKPATP